LVYPVLYGWLYGLCPYHIRPTLKVPPCNPLGLVFYALHRRLVAPCRGGAYKTNPKGLQGGCIGA
jgi:hypothetical protein